ncbi:MAG: HD domain-containing protein [Candidatus Berkelbacteria bacterium]
MNRELVKKIQNYVKTESLKKTSKYGSEPYFCHFMPVVKYAKLLQKKYGGDAEVIEIAGWLHDVGSLVYGRENHHITSAKIAVELLEKLDYPKEKMELVEKCILNHRGSVGKKGESIEEQIVAEADAMSNFENISGIFKAAFVYENLDQITAKKAVLQKLQNKWKQLQFAESKKLLKPKLDAARILLK